MDEPAKPRNKGGRPNLHGLGRGTRVIAFRVTEEQERRILAAAGGQIASDFARDITLSAAGAARGNVLTKTGKGNVAVNTTVRELTFEPDE